MRAPALLVGAAALALGITLGINPAMADEITFAEALERAAAGSPRQAEAAAESRGRFGLFTEQLGRFDWVPGLEARIEYERNELTSAQIEFEESRRLLERTLLSEFTRVADDLDRQIEEGTGRPRPDCRTFILVIDGETICVTDLARGNSESLDEVLRALIENANDPDERSELERVQQRLNDLARQTAINTVITLRNQAEAARIRLERLGAVPKDEERYTLLLDLGLRRLARNGLGFAAGLKLDGLEDNFAGKSIRPGYGGKGIPRTYRTFWGLALNIPLGRGLGVRSTGAPVAAAELGYQASQSLYEHRVRESELDAALAYWRLAAAEERLDLLDRALGNTGALRNDVAALAQAEEMAAADVNLAEARVASVRLERAQAWRELEAARARLADALGERLTSLDDPPRAADPLPQPAPPEALAPLARVELTATSLARRSDLESRRLLVEASNVLLEGARRDLRRVFDLSLSAGYSGLYESFSRDLLDPSAYGEALAGRQSGPSFSVVLKTRAPFANRQAQGRLRQSAALSARSRIEGLDLERSIALDVSAALADLQAAAAEASRRRTGSERAREVWTASRELLAAAEGDLLDVLVTDEDWLRAELDEVTARERWAVALARLRFALGLPVAGDLPDPLEEGS